VKENFVMELPTLEDEAPRYGALFVGRLSPEKGLANLFRAWEAIDYPLTVAGDGPLRSLCENVQNKNVRYLGRLDRDAIIREMKRAAFLIVPSEWYEMFGLVIIEAFSCGLPVIVSNIGGLAELVSKQGAGLEFNPGDITDLRAKIRWAISHPAELRNFGRNARRECERSFTPDVNYGKLADIYKELIDANQRASITQVGS
jgi:glycosyltransferase involved in cell wall biosynthesis